MAWVVNDKEFGAVSALPGARRYDYLVKRVADRGELWSLGNEGG